MYDRCNYIDSVLWEDWVLSLYVQILVCQEPWWWQFALVNAGHRWWRHQMETFSALLAICAGNSPVPGEFRAQRPGTRSFDVFFDLRSNKQLSKQWRGWWVETPSSPLWRHCNASPRISSCRVRYLEWQGGCSCCHQHSTRTIKCNIQNDDNDNSHNDNEM